MPAGATVFVTEKVLRQLIASEAVLPEELMLDEEAEVVPTEFEMAVAVKAQEIAEAIVAEAVSAAVEELVDDRDEAVKRAVLLQEERDEAVKRADLLQEERAEVETGRDNMASRAEAAEARAAELEQQVSDRALQEGSDGPTPKTVTKKADAKTSKPTAKKS